MFLFLAGTDYIGITGDLIFAPGSAQGDFECVYIPLIDDYVKELNESFTFAICPIRDEDVHITNFCAEVEIVDDDRKSFPLV